MVTSSDDLDTLSQPVTTLSGWRRFVDAPQATFTLAAEAERAAMTGTEVEIYDERRARYHAELVVVQTSTVRSVTRHGRKLVVLNQGEVGARRGLIVAGPAATGKTTSILQLGKTHELKVRARFPGQDRIPVVYITTPPKGSPKKLATEFANFLGLPTGARENVVDIAERVCQVLVDGRTDLVIVDEIHNLNLGTSAGEDMSDNLKYFADHLPATFIFAGINVQSSGLFSGVRGAQISGRFALTTTGAFPNTEEWKQLVATLDGALRLHHHRQRDLLAFADYLHARANGSISSLSHLVRAAAIDAIYDQSEKITRDLLDQVPLDHATQSLTPVGHSERRVG